MSSTVSELQEWYATHCDGDWEHQYGVSIGTIDNPGWFLCIDLEKTSLAHAEFKEVKKNYDHDTEWLICGKEGAQFTANGGPRQLERMIQIFLTWAKSNEPANAR